MMMEKFTIERGEWGDRVVVHGEWSADIAEQMKRRDIRELYLNHALGFRGKNLSFLSTLPNLEWLKVLDWNLEDDSAINTLHALRSLDVSTNCKTEINFSRFPRLEICGLEWRTKAKSLFTCSTLRKLSLDRYPGRTAADIARLTKLESLDILNVPLESVEELSVLPKLTHLGLYNLRKLFSLRGIERLVSLKELEINGCWAIRSIEEVQHLKSLQKLQLCDNRTIESLTPLTSLSQLTSVLFYGSTNVRDGDLSVLTALPRIREVAFQDRKHYSKKLVDIETLLSIVT